jgi:hypothetical protein
VLLGIADDERDQLLVHQAFPAERAVRSAGALTGEPA